MDADVTHTAGELAPQRVEETPRVAVATEAGWRRVVVWVAEHELWWVLWPLSLLALVDRVPVRWVIPGLVPIIGIWLARRYATGYLTARTPLDLPWVLILAMGVIALYPSVDLDLSLQVFLELALEAALFYQIINGIRGTTPRLWMVVGLLLAVGVGLAGLGAVNTQWSSKLFALPQVYARLPRLLPWLNPAGFSRNIVGGSLAMLFPVVGALLVWGNGCLSKRVLTPLLLGFGLVLVLSQSRGALAGTIVAMAVMIILWEPRWIWFVVPIGVVSFVVVWQVVGVSGMADFLLASEFSSSAQGRLELWSRAMYMLQDFPYTGIGIGTFSLVAPILYPFFLIGPDVQVPHAHNLYLQAGVDLGVPGLVAFIALLTAIALCAVRAVRNWGDDERVLAIGLTGGFVAYLIHGLVDNITFSTEAGAVMWLICSLIVALAIESPYENHPNRKPPAA